MRISLSFFALLIAIIGLLMYVLATGAKVVHIGDTMFWTGTLATLLSGPTWTAKAG